MINDVISYKKILSKRSKKLWLQKKKFGYYDENGKDKNIYNNWKPEVEDAMEKNSGVHYVKFKSEEEKKEFENNPEGFIKKKPEKNTSTKHVKNENNSSNVFDEEIKKIESGEWEEHLFEKITCENLTGYDALCVSDGSCFNGIIEDKGVHWGSFGIIVIPLKEGNINVKDEIIVESALLEDSDNDNEFKRTLYTTLYKCAVDEEVLEDIQLDTIKLDKNVSDKLGGKKYVESGYATLGEAEGAFRIIEICEMKKWKKIVLVSDCKNILNALDKPDDPEKKYKESDSARLTRLINKYKKWTGKMDKDESKNFQPIKLKKVGSHSDSETLTEINDVDDNIKDLNKDSRSRLYQLLNDLCDLMAKAELPPKTNGHAQKDNAPSVHLIPNENGKYSIDGKKHPNQEVL